MYVLYRRDVRVGVLLVGWGIITVAAGVAASVRCRVAKGCVSGLFRDVSRLV